MGLKSEVDQGFDKIQLILITLVMVFCTDGIIAQELSQIKPHIEGMELKYLTMLQRYLKDKYPEKAHSKLATGVMILHDAKEAHEIRKDFQFN